MVAEREENPAIVKSIDGCDLDRRRERRAVALVR
jgi:hypothetical protein